MSTATPAVVDPGGTIRMLVAEPGTIDPALVQAEDEFFVLLTFETLLTFEPQTLRVLPAAAEALPTVSPDGLRYTVTLREGLTYSDGSPVRARDFAYGWSRSCDPALNSPRAVLLYAVVGCQDWNKLDPAKDPPARQKAARDRLLDAGIVARGDRVLEFNLTRPASHLLTVLAMFMGAPVRESDVVRGGEDWTEPGTYIGNGPFVLTEWTHGQRLVFTANDRFRKRPKLKRWELVAVDRANEASVLAGYDSYRTGQLDIHAFLYNRHIAMLARDQTLHVDLVTHASNCTNFLVFNSARPPLDDARVRLALAKSFDRDAYVRDMEPTTILATSMIPRGMPGHDPADQEQAFDPDAARRLLASSRYAVERPAIEYPYALDAGKPIAEWFRDQWRKNLGIEVIARRVDGATLREADKKLETRRQIQYQSWCPTDPDQYGFLTRFAESTSGGPAVQRGYASAAFDALVRAAGEERDDGKRDRLYAEASRLLSHDAPAAIMFYWTFGYLRKPWVHGIADSPLDTYPGAYDLTEIYVAKH